MASLDATESFLFGRIKTTEYNVQSQKGLPWQLCSIGNAGISLCKQIPSAPFSLKWEALTFPGSRVAYVNTLRPNKMGDILQMITLSNVILKIN